MTDGMLIFLVGQGITVIGFVIHFYTKTQTRLSEIEIRLRAVEKQDDTIMRKLDEIKEEITDLKIAIQNKKDRED
jgi:hypothetical protein